VKNINVNIINLIKDLIPKVREDVPEKGDFTAVYSEFKNTDRQLCLTNIMLKVEAVPEHIVNYNKQRYLTCVGYKLPAPIKASAILMKGSKLDILDYLNNDSLVTKINKTILRLSDNLLDVSLRCLIIGGISDYAHCNDTGVCRRCNGNKKYYTTAFGTGRWVDPCTTCGGSGKCPSCGGTGRIKY